MFITHTNYNAKNTVVGPNMASFEYCLPVSSDRMKDLVPEGTVG